jgi:hypothetical protein
MRLLLLLWVLPFDACMLAQLHRHTGKKTIIDVWCGIYGHYKHHLDFFPPAQLGSLTCLSTQPALVLLVLLTGGLITWPGNSSKVVWIEWAALGQQGW